MSRPDLFLLKVAGFESILVHCQRTVIDRELPALNLVEQGVEGCKNGCDR